MLGKIPNEFDSRDAVHVATLPFKAGEELSPASWVCVKDELAFLDKSRKAVGIVDPYLKHKVKKGELFFLCLVPETVVGMTHHWHHPAFPDDINNSSQKAALEWIRQKEKELDLGEGDIIYLAKNYWADSDWYCGSVEGYDFRHEYPEIKEKLALLGMHLPKLGDDDYFRCAC